MNSLDDGVWRCRHISLGRKCSHAGTRGFAVRLRASWLRLVNFYPEDVGRNGLPSTVAMARQTPKEYHRKINAATRCSRVWPHIWQDLNLKILCLSWIQMVWMTKQIYPHRHALRVFHLDVVIFSLVALTGRVFRDEFENHPVAWKRRSAHTPWS